MKEQLISFETDMLAKEKGAYFIYSGLDVTCTQSLLQRWLREKHNIPVNVTSMYEGDYGFDINPINSGNHNILFRKKNVGTYEEALEAGLQEALKLIK